jgi:hypothetical protein
MATIARSDPQRAYLYEVKAELGVTWDTLAELAGIAPRALKTYRLPVDSIDRRLLKPLVKAAIERVLADHRKRAKRRATTR